jgi:hypothetical protein
VRDRVRRGFFSALGRLEGSRFSYGCHPEAIQLTIAPTCWGSADFRILMAAMTFFALLAVLLLPDGSLIAPANA